MKCTVFSKTSVFSKINKNHEDSKVFFTSRPSTATSRLNQRNGIKTIEILPDKSGEFVQEVMKIWDRIDHKDKNDTDEDEEIKLSKKTVMLKIPELQDRENENLYKSSLILNEIYGNKNQVNSYKTLKKQEKKKNLA